MSTIITDLGHTFLAKQLLNTSSIWVGIGQTSAWTDENNPPIPSATESTINEVIGYKKVTDKYLVTQDATGTIDIQGTKYKIIDSADYKTDKPNYVYLYFEIVGSELPLTAYRQLGVLTDLVPATGHTSDSVLLPADVSDIGYLITLDNRKVVTRASDVKDVFKFLFQT